MKAFESDDDRRTAATVNPDTPIVIDVAGHSIEGIAPKRAGERAQDVLRDHRRRKAGGVNSPSREPLRISP